MNDNSILFDQLKKDLLEIGVDRGAVILVHASFKALRLVKSSPEEIISTILDVLGPEGTLLMPALSYASVDAENPIFDQKNTPSCIGALPECFRKRKGTIRSLHPTHSVCAAGRLARELTAGHECDSTPCGPNSPFRKLREIGGSILMLGCGMSPNTSMHAVEEVAEVPYLLKGPVDYLMIPENGERFTMSVRRHNFTGYFTQRYNRLESILDSNALRKGNVLSAESYLINCELMWNAALNKLNDDPCYFVDPV